MPGSNEVPQGEAKDRWQCHQREAREVSIPTRLRRPHPFIETFHEELPQDGIGCHRGIRTFEPRDADSERDLSESARVTKYLLIATHNLAFALRCNRVPRLHRGHVEEVAPESLRRESRCRQKVLRLWTFSGTVRTNGRTGPAAGLHVVVAMLRETAVGYTEYHEPESLGTWVRWCLDCIIMMYGPKGFSRVWGLSLTL